MMLATAAEMSAIDARAQKEFSIPGTVLMESAGQAAWRYLSDNRLGGCTGQSIVFVVGSGNNGGDALVMARYCATERAHRPIILMAKDALKGDAEIQRQITLRMAIPRLLWSEDEEQAKRVLSDADWIVDGLAGTGLAGPLRLPLSEIVESINASGSRVASIDCPSGVGDGISPPAGETVKADLTLTLGLPKRCLFDPGFRAACGAIEIVPFTIPGQLVSDETCSGEFLTDSDLQTLMPAMPVTAHKGQRGIVAVYAGATGTTGAAVLASRAVLAAGAGLVTVIANSEIHPQLASTLTSVMVRPEDDTCEALVPEPGRYGAAVVGPGWGTHSVRSTQLTRILGAFRTGVLDADGLTLLAGLSVPQGLDNWVLTPHPAELGRLIGRTKEDVMADFFGSVREAARKYNAVVVAKACTTVLARPDGRIAVVDGMNPAMATAGSGDVLAGVIGALLGRGLSAWDAARCGVVAHSVAGRRLRDHAGLFRSSALPDEIGMVMGERLFRDQADGG